MRKDRIVFTVYTAIIWSILFFPLVWPFYLHIWSAIGIVAYFGALIFGTIGVGAIIMDVYHEIKHNTKVI